MGIEDGFEFKVNVGQMELTNIDLEMGSLEPCDVDSEYEPVNSSLMETGVLLEIESHTSSLYKSEGG